MYLHMKFVIFHKKRPPVSVGLQQFYDFLSPLLGSAIHLDLEFKARQRLQSRVVNQRFHTDSFKEQRKDFPLPPWRFAGCKSSHWSMNGVITHMRSKSRRCSCCLSNRWLTWLTVETQIPFHMSDLCLALTDSNKLHVNMGQTHDRQRRVQVIQHSRVVSA